MLSMQHTTTSRLHHRKLQLVSCSYSVDQTSICDLPASNGTSDQDKIAGVTVLGYLEMNEDQTIIQRVVLHAQHTQHTQHTTFTQGYNLSVAKRMNITINFAFLLLGMPLNGLKPTYITELYTWQGTLPHWLNPAPCNTGGVAYRKRCHREMVGDASCVELSDQATFEDEGEAMMYAWAICKEKPTFASSPNYK